MKQVEWSERRLELARQTENLMKRHGATEQEQRQAKDRIRRLSLRVQYERLLAGVTRYMGGKDAH